jgi:pyruvate,water dikinase
LIVKLAHNYLPLRGKASRLQALDIARAGARRLGELWAHDATIADPDDVFFLTVEEIASPPTDLKTLVRDRRELWTAHHDVELPICWQGTPAPRLKTSHHNTTPDAQIHGLGASAGVAEGRACVVTDPSLAHDDIEPGDILIAHTTDPSWASIMFVSGALVVDIGGMLSHAAVLARELGIPCVMGTATGTAALRTGDRVRVDGTTGRVEILARG